MFVQRLRVRQGLPSALRREGNVAVGAIGINLEDVSARLGAHSGIDVPRQVTVGKGEGKQTIEVVGKGSKNFEW